jgi:hypothetical protein
MPPKKPKEVKGYNFYFSKEEIAILYRAINIVINIRTERMKLISPQQKLIEENDKNIQNYFKSMNNIKEKLVTIAKIKVIS